MAQMDKIHQQFSNLRELPIKTGVPSFVISKDTAENMLLAQFSAQALKTQLKMQQYAGFR